MTTTYNSNFLNKQLLYWFPVYFYMIFIFYLSSQSVVPIMGGDIVGLNLSDYVKHSFEYFILSLLVYRAVSNHKVKINSEILTVILSGVYAISDEVHQLFIPGRQFSLLDILADLIGIIIAIISYRIIKKLIQKF